MTGGAAKCVPLKGDALRGELGDTFFTYSPLYLYQDVIRIADNSDHIVFKVDKDVLH